MEPHGWMSGIYRITEWIMRFMVINLLWLTFSLPFIFLAVPAWINVNKVLVSSGNPDTLLVELLLNLLPVTLLAPFILVPASTAMYSAARKWVIGETDVSLFKMYIQGYRQCYKQSMQGGLIFAFLGLTLFVDANFFASRSGYSILFFVFILLLIVLFLAFLNFMAIVAHYHMKLLQILKNSVLLAVGNPLASIIDLAAIIVIVILSIKFFFLLLFFMGSTIAYITFWQFYRGLAKFRKPEPEN